jgi:adenine specific DNA methylase Mod
LPATWAMSAILLRLEFPRCKPNRFIRFNFRERHAVCVTLRRCGVWGRWGDWGMANPNKLYFGDNLDVLRQHVQEESIDLIYLDPPFNSQATYNVLFKTGAGKSSEAQAEAFRDTWEWGEIAEAAYDDVMRMNGNIALVLSGLRKWLGENAMMAYLAMMAVRLAELRLALKPSGSLYLHCDPTASHYLKLLLDAIFGHRSFRNEITWKRTTAHSNVYRNYGDITDKLFFYTKGDEYCWNQLYRKQTSEDIERAFPNVDPDGRRWRSENMRNPGVRPNLHYPYRASNGIVYQPHPNGWTIKIESMRELDVQGKLHFPKNPNGRLRRKFYSDETPGIKLQSLWDDISPIGAQAQERLGYPTQKPIALLERIIQASSNEGMVVLDPFCGCGTTIEAAAKLGREWIGVDVTHYAITLIEERLKRAGLKKDSYQVQGRPTDLDGARDLARRDKHQFQWWAAWRLGAQTYREEKRGADRGIDGNIFFQNGPYGTGRIIISVKGGDNVGVGMVRDLRGVIEREDSEMGILVSLVEPTGPMVSECAAAGFVAKSAHGRLPRLQIVTIADMLMGKMPKLPPIPEPARIARPTRKRDLDQLELLLPLEGKKLSIGKGEFVDPRFDPRLIQAAE